MSQSPANTDTAILPYCPVQPGRSLLVLQNPGRVVRHYMGFIADGAKRLGLNVNTLELQVVWDLQKKNPGQLLQEIQNILVQHRVGAVVGYGYNGLGDMAVGGTTDTCLRSFWDIRGIPHLMMWFDHPHWHRPEFKLNLQMQQLFRCGLAFHFLKSDVHAWDMTNICGWPNTFGLPAAIDAEKFARPDGINPEFDLVAIMSDQPTIAENLKAFVTQDDPDVHAIHQVIAGQVKERLVALWKAHAPTDIHNELTALGERWTALKLADPLQGAGRFFPQIQNEFPGGAWYLHLNFELYIRALAVLYAFRQWQRSFYVAYLARYFKIAVFGNDWSSLGAAGGGWVDFDKMPHAYARGKVAMNIIHGHDEEGLTLKPFEIAASRVPMIHFTQRGLSDCFTPGQEVEVFDTPREAREKLQALLDNPARRQALADAAYQRLLRDHRWERRIETMFKCARLDIQAFKK